MCRTCEAEAARQLPAVEHRSVPHFSGEAAIYSPEYLARKEGNANGTQPRDWYSNVR